MIIDSDLIELDHGLLLPMQPAAQTWEDFLEAGVRLANLGRLDLESSEAVDTKEIRIQATAIARQRLVESGVLADDSPIKAWTWGALRSSLQYCEVPLYRERHGVVRAFQRAVAQRLEEHAGSGTKRHLLTRS